jgi:ABC-2 type transport system permease protein
MPIVDQGYQHWSGALSGHAWRWLTIARHGVRVGMKESKVRLIILFAWSPAVALAGALCLWGLFERNAAAFRPFAEILNSLGFGPQVLAEPKKFRVDFWTICYSKFMATELFVAMILMLLIGRQLISQDLRFNALPLYFSRPLRRSDYFIGKLGVIGGFLGMVIIVPSLIAYVLGMACSLDVTILRDTFPLLLAVIVYGLVITVSAGTLILALSSLSRNSRIVGLLWVGLWFVSNITASMLNTAFMFEQSRSGNRPSFLEARTSPANWSTLVSYTANLSRVGEKLLGADASWRKLADLQPESVRDNFLMRVLGPQYPWVWSAEVLIVLLLISACILHFRVRSLDRLK